MGINDVSYLNVKTTQENDFSVNLRSIPPSIFQDKLINSLGSDSFKSVLSDSKETDSVRSNSQKISQSNIDKRDVKKSESDVEESDIKETERAAITIQEKFLQSSLIESDVIDTSDALSLEFGTLFGSRQEIEQSVPLDDLLARPFGFSESMAAQTVKGQQDFEASQEVEQDLSLLHEGDTQINFKPTKALSIIQSDQRIEVPTLKSTPLEQQISMSKFMVSLTTPTQTINPLLTPIFPLNIDSASEILLGTDGEGVEVGSATGKPISFVEGSQHQKQLLNKKGEGGSEDNSEKSFEGSDSHAQQVSANAADSVQRTVAVQKLTQIIRDRAQDAIEKSKNDMTLNVKGIQTTLGEVELDLKITNKKISVRISSESKDMQTLLTQERSNIVSILNGLIDSTAKSEYVLADIPVEICHKEKGI
jgi:hypothetical protein